MYGIRRSIAGTTLALAVCAPSLAAEPEWLAAARAREGAPLPAVVVKSEDGWFTAKLPAKLLEKIVLDGSSYGVALDIGSAEQVNCEVLRESFDLAAMLRSTATFSFDRLATAQGPIDAREVERTDAGAYGDTPFMALDWVYLVKKDGKPLLGALKQIAATKGEYGVYCSHTDIGYSRTFATVVRALVESLQVKDAGTAPYFTEISTLSLGDRRIGVAASTLVRDADGDTKLVTATSMIVPVTPAEVRAHDSYDIQFIRPDGTLINSTQVGADNGEVDTNLALRPTDDGWSVEGEMKRKKLQQALPAEPVPGSYVGEARTLRGLLAAEKPAGSKHVHWTWLESDPLRLTEVRTEVIGPVEGGFAVRQSAGPITMDGVIDPVTGTAVRASLAIGANAFTVERVHVRGGF